MPEDAFQLSLEEKRRATEGRQRKWTWYVQRPWGQREHSIKQGVQGLSEAREVKGTGLHAENEG